MEYVGPSRPATQEQLHHLVSLMEADKRMSQGEWASPMGRKSIIKRWDYFAKNHLNKIRPGSIKSGEQWCQVWSDQKKHVRKLATRYSKAVNGTGGGRAAALLSDYQNRVLALMGGIESVVGFRQVIDPLEVDPILISSRERVQNESCRKRLKQQEEVVVISDDEDGFVSHSSVAVQDRDLEWAINESLRISSTLSADKDLEEAVRNSLATSVPNDTFDREINCAISASLKLNVPYLDDFDDNMNLAISESLKPTSQHRSEAQGSSKPLCVSLDTFKNKPKLVQQSHVIENKRGKSASQTLSTISSCKSLNVPLDDFDDNMNLAISESLKPTSHQRSEAQGSSKPLCYSLDTHKNKPKLVEQSHVTENTGGKSATQTLSNIPSCKSLNVPLYAFDENMNPAISESVKPTSHQSSEAQAAFKPLNVRLDAFDDNMNLGISESLKPTSHHRSEAQGSSKPLCVSLDTFKNKPKSVQQSHVTENTGGKSASQTPPNVSSCKSLRDHDYCTASPHVLDTSVSPPLHGPFLASDSGQSGSKRTSSAVKVARKVASAPYVRPPPERPPAKRVTDDTPWDRLVALGYAKFN